MYKVIGSDNREYGPASEEVLRRWIADGRANGLTQVKKEGEEGWRSLASLPEFAEALAAGIQPPVPAGTSAPGSDANRGAGGGAGWTGGIGGGGPGLTGSASAAAANALEAELLARAGSLDIGGCVQRSWELFQKNAWLVVAAWAVSFFVSCGVGLIPYIGFGASIVLGAVLLAGLHGFFLRLLRGEPASIADVFAGFGPSIGSLILCGIVSFVLVCVGMIPCFIPAIYLFVAWHFAPILILDRRLEFWHAMELSRKIVTRNWWAVFGLAIVALLLLFAGTLCCGIVVFVTGPIATGALVEAYRRLFETQGTGAVAVATPSTPAPSSPVAPSPVAPSPVASTPAPTPQAPTSGDPAA